MITRFGPGVGTAYVTRDATVLVADRRVDERLALIADRGRRLVSGPDIDLGGRYRHAVTLWFDAADAAIHLAGRGPAVVLVDGNPLSGGSVEAWRRRILIGSEAPTVVTMALDRHAASTVPSYRIDRGVVPAAMVLRTFGPLDEPDDAPLGSFGSTGAADPAGCVTALGPLRSDGGGRTHPVGPLRALVFSTGERVLLDRTVVVGRNPDPRRPVPDVGAPPRVVRLSAASVSRRHALVRVEGTRTLVDDLGSANGTRIVVPGAAPIAVVPGVPVPVVVGTVVELGDDVTFVVEDVA